MTQCHEEPTSEPAKPEWWNQHCGDMLKHLSRHLVAIFWIHARSEPIPTPQSTDEAYDARQSMATGFLLSVDGTWFVITAGHVLAQIEQSIASPRRLVKANIRDACHIDGNVEHVVFPLSDVPRLRVDRSHAGVDYGAILVPPHYARLIDRVGSGPVTEDGVASPEDEFHIMALLGFPRETQQVKIRREGTTMHFHTDFGTPLLPVLRTDTPPQLLIKESTRVYGQILSMESVSRGVRLSDIDGMSGGPLFGLTLEDDGVRYRLIGVQSGWDGRTKTIAACPIQPLVVPLGNKLSGVSIR